MNTSFCLYEKIKNLDEEKGKQTKQEIEGLLKISEEKIDKIIQKQVELLMTELYKQTRLMNA